MSGRRVAVTGASGRLGRALVAALSAQGDAPLAWARPDLDLDEPASLERLVARDLPAAVIHAAAWTDVDGCAREPDVAMRRNGAATGALATACAVAGIDLIAVSTNEVFDGDRTDGRGYAPGDEPAPGNPYGASKRAGEVAAEAAFAASDAGGRLAIVRTAWLYGPPGRDFPDKILDAAARAVSNGEAMKLVADEIGSPTFAPDLATALAALARDRADGVHHLVNGGTASRAAWARRVLAGAGVEVATVDVPASTWPRPSRVPRRAVLDAGPGGRDLRPWEDALAAYLPTLLEIRAGRLAEVGR